VSVLPHPSEPATITSVVQHHSGHGAAFLHARRVNWSGPLCPLRACRRTPLVALVAIAALACLHRIEDRPRHLSPGCPRSGGAALRGALELANADRLVFIRASSFSSALGAGSAHAAAGHHAFFPPHAWPCRLFDRAFVLHSTSVAAPTLITATRRRAWHALLERSPCRIQKWLTSISGGSTPHALDVRVLPAPSMIVVFSFSTALSWPARSVDRAFSSDGRLIGYSTVPPVGQQHRMSAASPATITATRGLDEAHLGMPRMF